LYTIIFKFYYIIIVLTQDAIKLETTGFEILEKQENITSTRIFDVGAIVYLLKAIPWELSGFSVEKYYNKLLEIHSHINEMGYLELDLNNYRFIIKARKAL